MTDFIKGIFSPSIATKAVDGIYNGIDKAFYTDEEKAENQKDQVKSKMKLIPLFEPFKLAQRIIAISFTINFIIAFWAGVAFLALGTKEMLTAYIELIAMFQLGWIMLTIVAWYFTGGVVNSFKTNNKDK